MGSLYIALQVVICVGVSTWGRATAHSQRRQLRYGSRAGLVLKQGSEPRQAVSESIENTAPTHQDASSNGILDDGFLNAWDSVVTLHAQPVVPQQGSLLQTHSEAEEEESEDAEERASGSASSSQTDREKEKSESPGEEVPPSDKEKQIEGVAKGEHDETSSNWAASMKHSSKDDGESSTLQEGQAHTKPASQTMQSSSEQKGGEGSLQQKQVGNPAAGPGDKAEEMAHEAAAGGIHEESTEFERLIGRLRSLLKASKGKELFSRLMTMIDLHGNELVAE